MQRLSILLFTLVAFAHAARAQAPAPDPAAPPAQPGSAPQTEPPPSVAPAAVPEPGPPPPKPEPKPETPAVTGKWNTSFYGFAEGDLIWDNVQGPAEALGNGALPRPAFGTAVASYASQHRQFTTSARNSRVGFRISAPAVNDIKASGQIEFDFLGNQPAVTEASLFGNATMRLRHANFKFETPVVDVLFGQYWQLFGWQPATQSGSIQYQGLPGFINQRAAQLRLSKVIKAGDVGIEIAGTASRPGHRAGALPDATGGLKLSYDKLKAFHIVGGTGNNLDSLSIGVSGIYRWFEVNEFKATSVDAVKRNGYGVAVNALIPVVPATKDSRTNAFTLMGEFIRGGAIADFYSGLNGGVAQPALPNPMNTNPAPVYTPNVDNGLMMFRSDGKLFPVHWQSYGLGAQYFLPPSGKAALIVNYSHLSSDNAHAFGAANRVFEKQDFVDGCLMVDIHPAVRLGADFVWIRQTYVDGAEAPNYRGQLTGYLMF
jgi:hypothetical protein